MDKMQALNSFWNGFGIKAYDENTVTDEAQLPYITYGASNDNFDEPVMQTANIWDYSKSWALVTAKEKQISDFISRGGKMIPYDGGAIWIRKGNPWAQRLSDGSNDMIRRIVLNVVIEFLD